MGQQCCILTISYFASGFFEQDCIAGNVGITACQRRAWGYGKEKSAETECEDHPTVSLLEEYCGLIYQIYQRLEENGNDTNANASHANGLHANKLNANKFDKLLRQKLVRVISSAQNNIPIRKEVVSLTDKASMWDSLKIVWKAVDEDPDCNAYVITILYYDRNPDGSFREMHYEVNQYPDYVPRIHYEDYDFQIRKPGAIYIHNSYDECNYATSVHPSFYSKKLKEYTKNLVYILFYIGGD